VFGYFGGCLTKGMDENMQEMTHRLAILDIKIDETVHSDIQIL
jgi:hypothetical protein